MAYSCVRVSFDIGHEASIRAKRTPEGFTHDWKVFVRGTDNAEIQHFVEKVVFHLHETFPKPVRVVKEPPFTVKESGYAGFTLPIEIYFKTTEEPKKFRCEYDLHLQPAGPPIHKVLKHPFTFPNPGEELRRRLIKGGGVGVGTEPGSQLEKLPASGGDEQSSAAPSLGSKSKLGWDATKKHKAKDLRPPEKFSNVFGEPIKSSSSKVSPDGTKKSSSSAPSPKISPSSKTVSGSTGGKQIPHHSKSGKHSSESRGSKEKEKDKDKDKDKDKEKKEGKERKDGSKSHHTPPKVPPPSSPSSKSSSHPPQVPGSQKQPSSSSSSTPPKVSTATSVSTKSSSSSHKGLKDDTTVKKTSSLATEETKSKSDAKPATESSKSEKKKKDKKNRDEKPKKEKHSSKHESASKVSGEKSSTEKVQKEHKDKEVTDTKKKDKEHVPAKESISKPSGEKEKDREKSKHSETNDKEKRHKHKKKDKSTKDRDREKQKERKSEGKEREKTEAVSQIQPETTVDVIKQDSSSPKQDSSSPSPENTSSKTWTNNYSGEAEVQNHTTTSQPAPPSKRPLNALIQEMEGNDSLSDLSEVEDVLPPPRQVVSAPPPPPPSPPPPPPPPPPQSSPSSCSPKQSSPAVTDPAVITKSGSNRATKEKSERSAAKKSKEKQPKEGKERKRKRHSSTSAATAEETLQPPPLKLPRQDSPEPEPRAPPEDKVVAPETQSSERVLTAEYVSQLRDLQRKIMTLEDNAELQKVVQVIAETGQYEITKKTFDFDLCTLDRSTVRKLQEFFAPS